MDVSKYIGLFLLKNHFCYIHGLGNMELKKKPGMFDGKMLLPPSYEVLLTSGGSIDDSLANFIASNEQVSISKASNELRDFSIQARKDMEIGKEVPIPGMGRFTQEYGKIQFIADENFTFTPASLPTIRNSKQLEEQVIKPVPIPTSIPIPPPIQKKSINWTMIILIIVLFVIVGGGGFGYYYYRTTKNRIPLPPELPYKDTSLHNSDIFKRDSLKVADSLRLLATIGDTVAIDHKIIIGNYPDLQSADRHVKKLKYSGCIAEVYVKDTLNYLILTQIACKNKDTTVVFDSLKHVYNYQDVKTFR